MKCLLDNCPKELAQLTALTLIVGVGWVELWKCPNHGVWSIPKGRETMKEVRCNAATEECRHWCRAADPHKVTEQCERSYCLEVRRQVKCESVPAAATPPVTCSRRTRDLCDLSGLACATVYDGVTCRAGRPGGPDAAWRRLHGDVPPEPGDGVEVGGVPYRWMKAGKTITVKTPPSVADLTLAVNSSLDSEPATITPTVYEGSVWDILVEEFCHPLAVSQIVREQRLREDIRDATARIMKLPRIRQEGGTGE
ncbi:hypothetical protein LCGC14_1522530 [marine sediment metagenome]|uniref:Uncharacterized protein n=1 Tax=marine sediment metagenome TaxID=412755 RepID=A0A0F9LZB1_9ZZZZ